MGLLRWAFEHDKKKNRIRFGLDKKCPYCGNTINAKAIVCEHCDRALPARR
jgi:hypothetical protein